MVLQLTYGIIPTLEQRGFLAAITDAPPRDDAHPGWCGRTRLWKEVLPARVSGVERGSGRIGKDVSIGFGEGRCRAPSSVDIGRRWCVNVARECFRRGKRSMCQCGKLYTARSNKLCIHVFALEM